MRHLFFDMISGSCLLVGVRPLEDLDPGVQRPAVGLEENLDVLDKRAQGEPAPNQGCSRIMKNVATMRALSI